MLRDTPMAALFQGVGLVCLWVFYRSFITEFFPPTSTFIIHYELWKYIVIGVFSFQSLLFVFFTQLDESDTAIMVWAFPSGFIWKMALIYPLAIACRLASRIVLEFVYDYNLQIPAFMTAALLAIIISYLAYLLKCRNRVLYGVLEVVFGVLGILYSGFTIILLPISWEQYHYKTVSFSQMAIQFFAGMYIIVRGLNNIEDGMKIGPLTVKAIQSIIVARKEERRRRDKEAADQWFRGHSRR